MSRTLVFYHIYCNPYTPPVLQDQLTKLIYSSLYKKADAIYCFLAGHPPIVNYCAQHISEQGTKFQIQAVGYNDTTYERFTLEKIRPLLQPGDKFMYLHSKGITKDNNPGVTDWRHVMEHFLIYQYQQCLDLLDTYDTVGINWSPDPKPHYSGNFWWSTADYFLKLPSTIGPEYHDPEFYIGLGSPNAKCLYKTNVNHYRERYPSRLYLDL